MGIQINSLMLRLSAVTNLLVVVVTELLVSRST
jgi:hypothetical protein